MARKYTQCYAHTPGDKPFNEKDLVGLALVYGVLPGALFGALTGLVAGFAAGGPIGALIGFFAGLTVGIALALTEAAKRWRFHRLVCVGGFKCAVGIVRDKPHRSDLGNFDNDEFFDLQLMPHPIGAADKDSKRVDKFEYDYFEPSDNYKLNQPGVVISSKAKTDIAKNPKNDVYIDDFQGSELVRPSIADLPYDTMQNWLHCEAEGDFWVRITNLALALGALIALLATATAVATAAGASTGAAIGCSLGSIFGPIGCLIGGFLGALLGGLLAGGAAAGLSYLLVNAILQAIFDAHPGDVEDANVGDKALGPISAGDKVLVYGEHVYDGFHEGWHEIHPLMAVVKLADQKVGKETSLYLEWKPDFGPADTLPPDITGLPGVTPDIATLTADDMRRGLNSDAFAKRAVWLREHWCGMLRPTFDEAVQTVQQHLSQRWTIHPFVDGCKPRADEPPPPGGLH